MLCKNCGSPIEEGNRFCLMCGTEVSAENPQPQQVDLPGAPQPALNMGWFKFLIYFSLFAATVLHVINAFTLITGSHYGSSENSELVYMVFPSMKSLDLCVGLSWVALAAFCLITRFRLAGYHKNGPTFLYIIYAANAILNLLYVLASSAIVSTEILPESISDVVRTMITSIVMIIINLVYFKKRKHLFINP